MTGAILKIISSYTFNKSHKYIIRKFLFKISQSFLWTLTEIRGKVIFEVNFGTPISNKSFSETF